jgi:iron complex transport system substrate-binding protein
VKIVSLLPSATEIVCSLGLEDSLVGVTHECDYPPSVLTLPKVTKTLIPHDASSAEIDVLVRERLSHQTALYSLDMTILERLRPDLIVTQALCDVCAVAEAEVVEAACSLPGHPKVINLEPMSLADVFDTLRMVGDVTGRQDAAAEVLRDLSTRVETVAMRSRAIPEPDRPRVAFLEWIDPPFSPGHWNPELIALAGGIDILGTPNMPSRTRSWKEVVDSQPDVIFVSCCGFGMERTLQDIPILARQPGIAHTPAAKEGRVYVTDGNAYFSRPGPRLVDSLEILAHALHPGVHPAPADAPAARHVSLQVLIAA